MFVITLCGFKENLILSSFEFFLLNARSAVTAAENIFRDHVISQEFWCFSNADVFWSFFADVFVAAATLQRQKKRKTNAETSAAVPEPSEYRCLVRATDGKKKISCSVCCLVSIMRLSSSRLCIHAQRFCAFYSFSVCTKSLPIILAAAEG